MRNTEVKFLTTKDVCERLNISRTSFWRLRNKGILPPPYELGPSLFRYKATEIDEAMGKLRPANEGEAA